MNVVDSSVAAKWLFAEQHSARADALLRDAIASGDLLIAPALLPVEATNIIWQRIRASDITAGRGQQLLAEFLTYPIDLRQSAALHRHALTLCITCALPAAYDAHYVALAQQLGAVLWTADQRLLRTLAGRLAFVRFIGDYPV